VLYELRDIAVATSPPYLERLNNPTPWSTRIFKDCRLTRALCRVAASHGEGLGGAVATIAVAAEQADEAAKALPQLVLEKGITGTHLLKRDAAVTRPTTNEEKLRQGGADRSVDCVVLVEGFEVAEVLQAAKRLPGEKSGYAVSHVVTASPQ
jgi:hypothetical protein